MGLLKRIKEDVLEEEPKASSVETEAAPKQTLSIRKKNTLPPSTHNYLELKEKIHRQLIDKLDLTKLDTVLKEDLTTQVREVVEALLAEEKDLGANFNRERLTIEILNETFGLGPLEPLLNDPTVSDILVNTHRQVYVERFGKLELTNTVFKDEKHLHNIIDRIVSRISKKAEESNTQ